MPCKPFAWPWPSAVLFTKTMISWSNSGNWRPLPDSSEEDEFLECPIEGKTVSPTLTWILKVSQLTVFG